MGAETAVLTSDRVTTERSPRKRLSLAVSLFVQGEELPGYCMNVSASGMLILQPREAPTYIVWSIGHLTGTIGGSAFRIKVRVARTDEDRVGVAFQISHPNDRELISSLLEAAAPEPTAPHSEEHMRELVSR